MRLLFHVLEYRHRLSPSMHLASLLALGFALGLRHAFDADHVAAITTIVTRHRSLPRATLVGALWGMGHTLTIFVVGGAMLLLDVAMPPRLGLALEFGVAVMLIGLGVRNLFAHGHAESEPSARRPLVVGMVHGLAGSAAVALLVLAAVERSAWALAYLLVFGAGTIAGMMAVTIALAVPALWATERAARLRRPLRMAAGALSLVVGVLLAHEVGFESGLFTATPTWTPH